MIPAQLIETGILLGFYAGLAGAYAVAFALSRFYPHAFVRSLPAMFYFLHCAVAAGVVIAEPLRLGWKLLIVASTAAVFLIPRFTWRYLERTHAHEV